MRRFESRGGLTSFKFWQVSNDAYGFLATDMPDRADGREKNTVELVFPTVCVGVRLYDIDRIETDGRRALRVLEKHERFWEDIAFPVAKITAHAINRQSMG